MSTYDYAKYGTCEKKAVPEVPQTTWQKYVEGPQHDKILDVRPSNQYDIAHLLHTINIPYEKLSKMTKEQIYSVLNLENAS